MNESFVRDYEKMAQSVEEVIAQYPPDMRDALRTYANRILAERLQEMWRVRLRDRLLYEEMNPRQ